MEIKKQTSTNRMLISDGIGQAYAVELASRGFNIALVSRNRDRLDATAKLIVDQHSQVEVKTFVFDCTIADLAVYEEKLLKPLVELEIGVLGECRFNNRIQDCLQSTMWARHTPSPSASIVSAAVSRGW